MAGVIKKITRREVAEKAGVSMAAVTKILNKTPGFRCREETCERVKLAARELGYDPAYSARSLKRGSTNILGLLLPTQDIHFHNTYYSIMIASLVESADDSEYYFIYLGQNTPEKYDRAFSSSLLDGVFVLQSSNDRQHINKTACYGKPLVTINFLNDSGYPEVSMDYEEGMEMAVEFLLKKNLRRMLYMTWDENNQPIQRYRKKFRELSRKYSDRVSAEEYIAEGKYLDKDDIARILALKPDGLIIDGCEQGIEVYNLSLKEGRKVGEDFELVILADNPMTEKIDPNVLVLQSQPEKVGRQAWQLMKELLAGKAKAQRTLIPFLQKRGNGTLIESKGCV